MANHSSASVRVETPHETETTPITISDALRRRAQSVINDRSVGVFCVSVVDEFRAKTHHRVTENTEIAQRTPATAGEHEGEINLTWKPVGSGNAISPLRL